MMKNSTPLRLFFIILICAAGYTGHTQKGKIAGRIFSASPNDMIPTIAIGATIKLLDKDSMLIRSILTDSLGNFLFRDLPAGTYTLQAEALSYVTTKKPVHIAGAGNKVIPDTIFMQPSFRNLESVMVAAKRPKVVVKS